MVRGEGNFFAQLVGQQQAVALLTQAIATNRIAPAYLFVGADGTGRSLAARCFVSQLFNPTQSTSPHRSLLSNHPDLLWVEPTYLHQGQRLSATAAAEAGLKRKAPPQIRLEQIREIIQFLSRPPAKAARSVVVIEQAETMAEAAANALLKILEEPGQATLILIAPGVDTLLPTIVSRCQQIPFHRLNSAAMAQVLKQNHYEEILHQPEVLALAQGSPGEAIAAWQQLQAISSNSSDLLQAVVTPPKSLLDALKIARQIDKTLDTPAQLWLVDYLQHVYWQKFLAGTISRLPLQHLEYARQCLLAYAQPRLVWETTLLKLFQEMRDEG